MEETILADEETQAEGTPVSASKPRSRGAGAAARVLVSCVLIAALLALSLAAARALVLSRKAPPRHEVIASAPLVESTIVHAGAVQERFSGYGTAAADRAATLSAEVSSLVVELVGDLEAGDAVEDNQPLVRLDDREFQLALERAQAQAAAEDAQLQEIEVERGNLEGLKATALHERRIAEDERRRVSDLFEQGEAHKREYDVARLAYQQTVRLVQNYERELSLLAPRKARIEASQAGFEAAAAIAQLNVERCEIKAPFAGSIESLMVEVGDRVQPATPVLDLIDPRHVDVAVQLPASAYDHVSLGATCTLRREAGGELSWRGKVERKAASTSRDTRTFAVHIDVDNTRHEVPLVPGTFVSAVVNGPVRENAILVPRAAVRRGSIMVAVDEIARRREVRVRRFLGDEAWIEGRVLDGATVILSHLDTLADGSPVRLGDPGPESAGEGGDQ